MTTTCDRQKTQSRKRKLKQYLTANVLAAGKFKCEHCKDCKSSHAGKGIFWEGQLHHVGKFYDLRLDLQPLRVVIVGQEYGHGPSHVSLEARYNMVWGCGRDRRFKAEPGYKGRNSHLRGITSVLRLLFDIGLGADHDKEFLTIHGKRVHIFDAFALVNYLLCSAVGKDGSMRGRATTTMKKNCMGHFQKVMNILEPSVIIVQGKGYWKTGVRKAFESVKKVGPERLQLYRATLKSCQPLVAVLSHPSARDPHNWGTIVETPYLRDIVKPSIKWIGQHLRRDE